MSLETVRLLGALRRISQSLDTHSKRLEHSVGLTVPQLLVLEALRAEEQPLSAGQLALRVSLSQGTITAILDRLEAKRLVSRVRAEEDRRRVLVAISPAGQATLGEAPPLLQKPFTDAFERLDMREREGLIESIERVAELMRVPEAPLVEEESDQPTA